MRSLLLGGILCALLTSLASAQDIRGTIYDEVSGQPLPGAAVFLVDLQGVVGGVTRSGTDGSFLLRSTAGDTVRVRAERFGYETAETKPWVLGHASTLELEVRLQPAPLALEPVAATAWRSRNRAGFERRRRSEPWGRFADAERLSRVRSPRAADRLRPVIPGMVVAADGVVRVRTRGVDLSGVPTCQPRYVIDGMRIPGDVSLDFLVEGTMIRAVEYYSNPQQAPAQFSTGMDLMWLTSNDLDGRPITRRTLSRPCAIIVIWTEIGFGEAGG